MHWGMKSWRGTDADHFFLAQNEVKLLHRVSEEDQVLHT